ncbi:hypothetical protein [Saccharothrix saharensis]|uniref:hypothetical protein n=1 Tax=Saccharothrix saharensis TaxID=571190 RepID=UPI001B86EDE2|nr:hypothetical protein [Saccharothrix saharensis]
MPLPMRPDWGEELEWPYPGLPAAMVAEFAGHRVAGLPFFTPGTIITDYGSVYRNHHLVEVQRVLGAIIVPARVLRPTDKHAVERAFGAIRSLLFEHLRGREEALGSVRCHHRLGREQTPDRDRPGLGRDVTHGDYLMAPPTPDGTPPPTTSSTACFASRCTTSATVPTRTTPACTCAIFCTH